MTKLTPDNVHKILRDCLYAGGEAAKGEPPAGAVIASGIVNNYGFDPERLGRHEVEIKSMLAQLPEQFHKGSGDGWSFLNACTNRDGEQWTGEHRTMEALFCLGLGIGAVKELLPREMWSVLPGGVPYYMVEA